MFAKRTQMEGSMIRRHLLIGISTAGLVAAGLVATALPAAAQDTVKVGLILPMTGPSSSTGNKAAGKTVELIVKDDTGAADVTKRLAQELVVNDKVSVLMGFGLTPLALA